MRFRLGRSTLTLVALGLAACSDASQPLPHEVNFQFTNGPACDYRPVKKDARTYFPKAWDNPVQELIRAMQQAGTDAEATAFGWEVIALIGQVTRDGLQEGSPQVGSDLTNGLLACMTFATATAPSDPIDFTTALDSTGAFDVVPRDPAIDPFDNLPVLSADPDLTDGIDARWGVEPVAGATWTEVTDGQTILVYGYSFYPVTGAGEEPVPGVIGFEWFDVPDISFAEDVRVSTCQVQEDMYRVQRGGNQILPVADPSFCTTSFTSTDMGSRSLVALIADWVLPKPLQAAALAVRFGGIGGTAGGYTPFVVVDPGAVNLEFTIQPVDAVIDPVTGVATLEPVEVTATGNNGSYLPEVTITLTVAENNGNFVELGGTTTLVTDPGCSSQDSCEPTGTVTFTDLTLNKPGGFRLVATATWFGFDQAFTATSEAFHIKQ